MSESAAEAETHARRGRKPLILGFVGALIAGAAGFFVSYGGMLGPSPFAAAPPAPDGAASTAAPRGRGAAGRAFVFVALDPIVVNVGVRERARLLRFSAELEVVPEHAAEVARLRPRILDVLNTYLRALEMHELEEPAALIRLRSQMLRRVQIVTGAGKVNDLLITEFVFN